VAVLLSVACSAAAEAQPLSPELEAAHVVQSLLDRDAVVRTPVGRRTRLSIPSSGDVFPMPGGPSHVVLLQLPDASAPYELILRTAHSSALIFDDAVRLRRVVPEYDFVGRGVRLWKESRLETTIAIDPRAHERFVLLYGLPAGARLELESVPSKK
jgi:hypothetical protein